MLTFTRPTQSDERIDTRVIPHLRILNGSLDDDPNSPAGVLLLGRIDPATFRFLRIDDANYQRVQGDRSDIFEALREGKVPPPIDIGVRGQDYYCEGSDFIIRSPAYIIDGGGRAASARKLLDLVPQMGIRLYAMLHFNTDATWEAARFDELNKNIRKVSSSLHFRNIRGSNDAILTLYGLTMNTPQFPLYNRVCWLDNMARGDLTRITTLAKVVLMLHGHQVSLVQLSADKIAAALQRAADKIGLPVFRSNISTFFTIIDGCWPIRNIEYRHAAVQLKASFLNEVARMLSDHPCFWDPSGRELVMHADDRRKLAKFPLNDPTVISLSGSAGKARNMLYRMLVDHMNSGRRTNKLVQR